MAKKHSMSKEELRQPDEVLTLMDRGWEYVREHAKGITLTIILVLLVTVAYYTVKYMLESRDIKSSRALISSLEEFLRPLEETLPKEKKESLEPGDRKPVKSLKERYESALTQLNKGINDCGGSGCAVLKLFRAKTYLELSRLDDAKKKTFLNDAISDVKACLEDLSEPLKIPALEIMGISYEELGQYETALSVFRKLATREAGVYAGEAMLHQARILEFMGKQKEAVELYKQIYKTKTTGLYAEEMAKLKNYYMQILLTKQFMGNRKDIKPEQLAQLDAQSELISQQISLLSGSLSVLDPGEYAKKRLAFLDLGLNVQSSHEPDDSEAQKPKQKKAPSKNVPSKTQPLKKAQ